MVVRREPARRIGRDDAVRARINMHDDRQRHTGRERSPSLPALRERINTPDGMVNTDLLFSRLIDNGTTPDPARIGMAMGILGPLEANAPTDACYRIIGLKAMLGLAMGDGEQARELAEQAIGYDASDRFASSVLDRLPETDPVMEATNVWGERRASGPLTGGVDAVPREATGPAG